MFFSCAKLKSDSTKVSTDKKSIDRLLTHRVAETQKKFDEKREEPKKLDAHLDLLRARTH